MTNHLDEAATTAVELAAELCTAIPIEEDTEQAVVGRRIRVAAHLTYLAGLIRGGAVQETGTDVTARGIIANERNARLRAEAELRDTNAHLERALEPAASIELEGLRRRVHALRAALKDLLDNDGDLIDEKRRNALARTYRESETPAQAAARLHVE